MSGYPHGLEAPGKDYELRGNEIVESATQRAMARPEIPHNDAGVPIIPDSATELLPCPFCGKEAYIMEPHYRGMDFQVGCDNDSCPASPFVDGESHGVAVVLWNRRAALAATADDQCPNCGFSPKQLLKSEAQAERGEYRPLSEAIEELKATADAPPEPSEEMVDAACHIAAKRCPTCGLPANNYCRDVFHATASGEPCKTCGTPAFVDRDEEQWWRQYCALGPELRLELVRFASALKNREVIAAQPAAAHEEGK